MASGLSFIAGQAANLSSAYPFVDAIESVLRCHIPWDLLYFQSLDRIVQTEPWLSLG